MNILRSYRDDGPVGALLGNLLRGAARHGLLLAASGGLILAGAAATAPTATDPIVGLSFALSVPLLAAGRHVDDTVALRWLMPPLLRACEYGWVIALAAAGGALVGAYPLLAALAFRHYDIVYRIRHQGSAPPRWIETLCGGWPVRMAVVYGLAVVGIAGVGLLVLAILLAVPLIFESAHSWLHLERSTPDTDYEEEDIG